MGLHRFAIIWAKVNTTRRDKTSLQELTMKNKLESRKHSSFTEAANYHWLVEFVANRNRQSRCHANWLAGRNRVFSVHTDVSNAVFYVPRDRWGVARQPTKYYKVAPNNSLLSTFSGDGVGGKTPGRYKPILPLNLHAIKLAVLLFLLYVISFWEILNLWIISPTVATFAT